MKMQIICKGRGKGKTIDLITLAGNTNKLIVCSTQKEADRIHRVARKLGMRIHVPITYTEFLRGDFYIPGMQSFLIDNVEELLQKIGRGVPIEAITITKVITESTKAEIQKDHDDAFRSGGFIAAATCGSF